MHMICIFFWSIALLWVYLHGVHCSIESRQAYEATDISLY